MTACKCAVLERSSIILQLSETGGVTVRRAENGQILFGMTEAEFASWIRSYEVTSLIWKILIDASQENFFEPGEITTPYRQIVCEDSTSEIVVKIECSEDRTCLSTTKDWLHRNDTFYVYDSDKHILENWLRSL